MYPLDGGRRFAQQQAQQRAMRQAQQRAVVDAQMRQASLERAFPKPQSEWQRQLTARSVCPNGPVPPDAWKQLKAGRGTWRPDGYTVLKHGQKQLEVWLQIWLTCTPGGRKILAEMEEEKQRKLQAKEELEERKRHWRAEAAARHEYQERYRQEVGTVVRIKKPQSEMDGRLGRVMRIDFEGEVLWASVLVDPLPPDHPMATVPPRSRPWHLAPTAHRVKAEHLTREHPEAIL